MHNFFNKLVQASLFILITANSTVVSALPEQSLVPGGIALLQLPNHKEDTRVYFNDRRVAVFTHQDTR